MAKGTGQSGSDGKQVKIGLKISRHHFPPNFGWKMMPGLFNHGNLISRRYIHFSIRFIRRLGVGAADEDQRGR